MTIRRQAGTWSAVAMIIVLELVMGGVAYFIAFLMAYGFEDTPSSGQHLFFVALVLVIAVVSWLVVSPIVASMTGSSGPDARHLAAGVTVFLHGAALAAGTLASGANEEQNSVTAGWATGTYVLVVGAAAAVALTGLVIARSAWPKVSA